MDTITDIFELFGAAYLGDFSKYMYQSAGYTSVFLVTLLLPLLTAFVYYILLDNILLAQRKKWTLIGAAACGVAALVSSIIANRSISSYTFMMNIHNEVIGMGDYLAFAFIVFVYAAVLYVGSSCLFKQFSSCSRNIPF